MHDLRDERLQAGATEPLSHADAVWLAERYVGAFNNRDLEAMLAVQDESVLCYPAPLFGHRPHSGHAGVRDWWAAMLAGGRRYQVLVGEVRLLGSNGIAILGQVHEDGEVLSPWGVLVRVREGLIVETRSYLSDTELLDRLQLLGEPPHEPSA